MTNEDRLRPTRTNYDAPCNVAAGPPGRRAVQRYPPGYRAVNATQMTTGHDAKNSRNSRQSELLYIKFTRKEQTLRFALLFKGKSKFCTVLLRFY